MPIIEDQFDQHKIDGLKRYLQREAEKSRGKDYEIIVDGFKVVSRTGNIEEFEDYEEEVKPETRNVSILIYDGPSTNRNTKYSFTCHNKPAVNTKGLNGMDDLGSIIAEKLNERDREHETARLKEKLEDTEKQLEESIEYADLLAAKIKEMEHGEHKKMVGLGDVAGFVFNGWLKQNPQLMAKIPGGNALAGLLDLSPAEAAPVQEDTAASFEKKNTPPNANEQQWLLFRTNMENTFKKEGNLKKVMAIVNHLALQTEQIQTVADLLNLKNE